MPFPAFSEGESELVFCWVLFDSAILSAGAVLSLTGCTLLPFDEESSGSVPSSLPLVSVCLSGMGMSVSGCGGVPVSGCG